MNTPFAAHEPQVADQLFLALGQTLYACQLFEATLLEVVAHAQELLEGTGDGNKFFESIEALSRKTLGQLLHDLRKKADLRPDIELRLNEGLDARNFIVHRFADEVADENLNDETSSLEHRQTVYKKCATVMAGHDVALSILESIAKLNSEKSAALSTSMREKAAVLRKLASKYTEPRH